MLEVVYQQFEFNVPCPFPYDLRFEIECKFTWSTAEKVVLEVYDITLGEHVFTYKNSGDCLKNILYGWNLCTKLVLAYALNPVPTGEATPVAPPELKHSTGG